MKLSAELGLNQRSLKDKSPITPIVNAFKKIISIGMRMVNPKMIKSILTNELFQKSSRNVKKLFREVRFSTLLAIDLKIIILNCGGKKNPISTPREKTEAIIKASVLFLPIKLQKLARCLLIIRKIGLFLVL